MFSHFSQEYFEEILFEFSVISFFLFLLVKKSIIDFAIFLGSSESSIIPHSFLSIIFLIYGKLLDITGKPHAKYSNNLLGNPIRLL